METDREIRRRRACTPRLALSLGLLALYAGAAGCAAISPTARRTAMVATGTAIGGGAGYVLGDKAAGATALGAVVGGAVTNLGLGDDPDVRQEGFDAGYVQGQSDAIKREYFLRQAREIEPPTAATLAGEMVYYVMPGPEVMADGRKLEPHQVAVRVVE